MKKLSIVSAVCLASITLSGAVSASNQVTYSTDAYCALDNRFNKMQHQKRFLKAYANKLGLTPNRSFCKELRTEQYSTLPAFDKSWNYSFNKPYAGFVRRLSAKVVKLLKAKKALAKDVLASL